MVARRLGSTAAVGTIEHVRQNTRAPKSDVPWSKTEQAVTLRAHEQISVELLQRTLRPSESDSQNRNTSRSQDPPNNANDKAETTKAQNQLRKQNQLEQLRDRRLPSLPGTGLQCSRTGDDDGKYFSNTQVTQKQTRRHHDQQCFDHTERRASHNHKSVTNEHAETLF